MAEQRLPLCPPALLPPQHERVQERDTGRDLPPGSGAQARAGTGRRVAPSRSPLSPAAAGSAAHSRNLPTAPPTPCGVAGPCRAQEEGRTRLWLTREGTVGG